MMLYFFFTLIISYLLGSLNGAAIIARHCGIDLSQIGSGNYGATNITRAMGKKVGAIVLLFDAVKVLVSIIITVLILQHCAPDFTQWSILGAWFCVIGHCFPLFNGFRGGKGVATYLGFLLSITFLSLENGLYLIAYIISFIVIAKITKMISVSSILLAIIFSIVLFCFAPSPIYLTSVGIAIVIIWQHRSNLTRILQGTENKIS